MSLNSEEGKRGRKSIGNWGIGEVLPALVPVQWPFIMLWSGENYGTGIPTSVVCDGISSAHARHLDIGGKQATLYVLFS